MSLDIRTLRFLICLTLFCFNGIVFKATAAAHFQSLRSLGFPALLGSQPEAPLTEASDGALYGTTYGAANKFAGTVFRMNKEGSGYHVLYKFSLTGGEGQRPFAGVIEAKDGVLYGTTFAGGASGRGTVFKLNKDGSGYAILHGFQGSPEDGAGCFAGLLEGSNGVLYGTTIADGSYGGGTVFSLNKDGSHFQILRHFRGGDADGAVPRGGLVEGLDGALYGTTTRGGISNAGAVFKLNKDGGGYKLLHSFAADSNDGKTPWATLLRGSNGVLYGNTTEGGTTNGTVFKLNQDGSAYAILHTFRGPPDDGVYPIGALVEGNDGALYGTTATGGANSDGTIFRLNQEGTGYTNLHYFDSREKDGALPRAGLIQASDHLLYGTTQEGGASRMGTAFRFNTQRNDYSVLHDFNFSGTDGFYPVALEVSTNRSVLYGTTQDGGSYRDGTVFKLNADGSEYTVLHSFSFPRGRVPFGILPMADGLYGTTYQGGTNDLGTIFKLDQDGSNFTVLRYFGEFPGEGAHPLAGLLSGGDDRLYGTTRDNGPEGGSGTVFRLDSAGTVTVLHSFNSGIGEGDDPTAGLVQGTDGNLYGVHEPRVE